MKQYIFSSVYIVYICDINKFLSADSSQKYWETLF